jgi:hypothetical protein
MFLKNVGNHVQTTRRHNPEDRKWLCVGGRGYTRNGHVFDLHTGINRPLRKASPSGTGARNARGHFDPSVILHGPLLNHSDTFVFSINIVFTMLTANPRRRGDTFLGNGGFAESALDELNIVCG